MKQKLTAQPSDLVRYHEFYGLVLEYGKGFDHKPSRHTVIVLWADGHVGRFLIKELKVLSRVQQ